MKQKTWWSPASYTDTYLSTCMLDQWWKWSIPILNCTFALFKVHLKINIPSHPYTSKTNTAYFSLKTVLKRSVSCQIQFSSCWDSWFFCFSSFYYRMICRICYKVEAREILLSFSVVQYINYKIWKFYCNWIVITALIFSFYSKLPFWYKCIHHKKLYTKINVSR